MRKRRMEISGLADMERKFAELQEIYSHVEIIESSAETFAYAFV